MTIWVRSNEIWTNPDNSYHPCIMFGNTYTNQYLGYDNEPVAGFAFNKFCTYDLKPAGVTADARFCNIGGILIITGGAEIQITFRAPGSTETTSYTHQLLSASASGGERSVAYDTIPLVDGCFEASVKPVRYPNTGPFAAGVSPPAVGWNFKLKAWGRENI